MIVTVLIVAVSGINASTKAYNQRQKRKDHAQFLKPDTLMRVNHRSNSQSALNLLLNKLASLLEGNRRQQLQEISSSEGAQSLREAEKAADRNLAIASASLGLAGIGALFYYPLGLVSLLGYIYICRFFFESTYTSLVTRKKLNVDSLVAVNTILLVVYGHFVLGNLTSWLWAFHAKFLTRIKDNSRKDLIDVFRNHPRSVWVLAGETELEVPFEDLKRDDIVVVHAGEVIPVDGEILDGLASIDQHVLTGEAQPVDKSAGDTVFASTTVLSGRLHIKPEKTGGETTAAQIGHILNETVDFKTDLQLWAEQISDQSVWPTLILSALSYPFFGPLGPLVILYSNPKYKLLTPAALSIMSYFNLTSKIGILIKDGRTLERLHQVDTVVFDKTGTLTEEQRHVGRLHTYAGYGENEVLAYAATAEHKQTHPIARAIRQEARERRLPVANIDDAEYKVGYGVTVTIDHKMVRIGSLRFIEMEGLTIPTAARQTQVVCVHEGHSLVLVAIDDEVAGAVELHATVRPEAKIIIGELRQRHRIQSMYIISGDHEAPTKRLAEELGIDHYFAEVLPENKAELIEQLQQQGQSVCYVGDGINDAIALRKADVSVSLRGASTLAIDTAQVVLMNERLTQLSRLFDLGRGFDSNMKTTCAVVIIPSILAVSGVFGLGFGLTYAIILNQFGFVAGVAQGMWPLLENTLRPQRLLQ